MINEIIRKYGSISFIAKGRTKVSSNIAMQIFNRFGTSSWSDSFERSKNSWTLDILFTDLLNDDDINLLKNCFKDKRTVEYNFIYYDFNDNIISL